MVATPTRRYICVINDGKKEFPCGSSNTLPSLVFEKVANVDGGAIQDGSNKEQKVLIDGKDKANGHNRMADEI